MFISFVLLICSFFTNIGALMCLIRGLKSEKENEIKLIVSYYVLLLVSICLITISFIVYQY